MLETKLKEYIRKLVQEMDEELEEITTTANIDGFDTPYAFLNKKSKKDKEKRQHAGLIAQEVEQHIKEVVIDDHADGKKGIDYNGLIPYLVECIKTQQKQIDTLNDRIASLENK